MSLIALNMYSVNIRVAAYRRQKFIEFWGEIKWLYYPNEGFQDPSILNGQIQKAENQYIHSWIQQTQQSTEYIW